MHYLEQELKSFFKSGTNIWQFFQEYSLDGVWYWDLEQPDNLWISPEYWQLLGIEPSSKKHSPEEFVKVVFEQDLDSIMDNLQRHYDDPNIPYQQIVRFHHANGSTVWVRCRGIAIRDANGKAIRMLGAHNDLTAEKNALAEMTKAQQKTDVALQKLKLVTESSKDGFWHWVNPENDEVEWSDGFFQLLGYEPQEFTPSFTLFQSMLHPDDVDKTITAVNASISMHQAFDIEYRIKSKSGKYHWYRGRGTPYFNDSNQFVEMAGSISNINHHKLLDLEIQKANERFEMATQGASVGIFDWYDIDNDRAFVSDRFLELVGLTRDKDIQSFAEFSKYVHEDDFDALVERLEQAFAGKIKFDMQYRVRHQTLGYRWWRATGIVRKGSEEMPLRMVGSVEDITSSKNADIERKQLISELALSNDFTGTILNSSKHLVIATDVNGVVTRFNAAAESVLGYLATDVEGKETPALWHDPKEVIARAKTLSKELGQKVEPGFDVFVLKPQRDGQESNEWTFIKKDGSTFPVNLTVTCIRDNKGEITGYLGVIEDITERRHKDLELQAAKQKAEVANVAKSRFLASMSHEIRTPMNGILGTLQLLDNEIKDTSARRLLKNALNSSHSLLTIVNDILDFSKIEANMLSLEEIDFSIQQLLEDVLSPLILTAENKGLTFNRVFSGSLPDVWVGDPVRVKQVLTNLVSNAVKFTEEGSVTVCVSANNQGLVIEVKDTGIGMNEAALAGLFERFAQADSSTTRKYGGTGLGMAITQNLVELMQGELRVTSKVSEGSEFIVKLPLKRGAKPIEPRPKFKEVPDLSDKRILVAEDNMVNQTIIKSILSKTKVQFEIAENGLVVIEKYKSFNPDLILMDIQMPELDGVEACKIIRRENNSIPIIALTANVMREDVDNYLKSGFDEHLAKPLEVEIFYQRLTSRLAHFNP